MVVVAQRYGLSDVGMAKLCRRAQIPVPPRGHWAKVRTGKPVTKASLADLKLDVIAKLDAPRALNAESRQEAEADLQVAVALERERHPAFLIRPEARLAHHPVTARIENAYRGGRTDMNGLLVAESGEKLGVSISPQCVARGLKIIDLLAHASDARGWTIELAERSANGCLLRPLRLNVLGYQFDVILEEGVRWIEAPKSSSHPWRVRQEPARAGPFVVVGASAGDKDFEPRPDGGLALSATYRYRTTKIVNRPKRGLIECRLNELFTRMIRVAADFRAEEAKQRREEREREVAWCEHEDREYVRKFQARLLGQLEVEAAEWAKSRQLAAYVAAVRDAYAAEPEIAAPDQPLGRWLAWADACVERLDPRRRHKLDPENPPPVVTQPRPPGW